MRRPRAAWGAAALSVALVASAWLPLPLPAALLAKLRLAGPDGTELELRAERLRLRWGAGRVEARGVEVRDSREKLLEIAELSVRLDLRPGRGFLAPRALLARDPVLHASPRLLRGAGRGDQSGLRLPSLPVAVAVENGVIHWTDPERQQRWSATGVHLRGLVAPRLTRLHGTLSTPGGLSGEAWFEARDGGTSWTLDARCSGREIAAAAWPEAAPFHWSIEALDAQARLRWPGPPPAGRQQEGELDAVVALEIRGGRLWLEDPERGASLAHGSARGSLARGWRFDLAGAAEGSPWNAAGWLKAGRGAAPPELALSGSCAPLAIDAAWADRLRYWDDSIGEVLDGLEPRGVVTPLFALNWRGASGATPQWAARAPLAGLTTTFRGFPEDDNERPSFPYPVELDAGELVLAGLDLLGATRGRMGEGDFGCWAAVELGRGKAGITADLQLRGLAVDGRVTHAVSGTPDLAALWRDLGGPRGGRADLDLRLRRRPGAEDVGIALDGTVRGTELRLAALPVPGRVERLDLRWRPKAADFSAELNAAGGAVELRGAVRPIAGAGPPALSLTARARDLQPALHDRQVLEGFLQLPEHSAELAFAGPGSLSAGYRRAAGATEPEVLLQWNAGGAELRWEPTALLVEDARGHGYLGRSASRRLAVAVPRLAARAAGGGDWLVSLEIASDEGRQAQAGRALLVVSRLELTPEVVATAGAMLDFDAAAYAPRGALDLRLEMDPFAAAAAHGVATAAPLYLQAPGVLAAPEVELSGPLHFAGATLNDGTIVARNAAGTLQLSELQVASAGDGYQLSALLNSEEGVDLDGGFAALVSPAAWAAFERIGLKGRVGAQDLRLSADGGGFALDGSVLLRDMQLSGPPRMRDGSGRLRVESFAWRDPQDFEGALRLEQGSVRVNGIRVDGAQGQVVLSPEEIRFRRFSAGTLGGTVSTFGRTAEGLEEEGEIRLGLQAQAPLSVFLYLTDLSLTRVREELQLGGTLSGKVHGKIDFRSASPSPLDYTGSGFLEIESGRLGAVPLLAQMWKVADVRPPVFSSGRVEWRSSAAGSRGRVRIERFQLDHPLLAVQGSGWVDLDSYLDMKATVRTLSFVTRLPLISDLVDLLIEQSIYGPVEHPVIAQRILRKYQAAMLGEAPRERFPLWLPGVEVRDWRSSPALPVARP